MRVKRGVPLVVYPLAATAVAVILGCLICHRMGFALFQPSVDTSNMRVSISESKLFTDRTLHEGVRHIVNDSSSMRGCEIKEISHTEHDYYGDFAQSVKDIEGTQTSFTMEYACSTFNPRTMSMSPADSFTWYLMYSPSESTDGTGWKTISYGNG